MAAVGPPIWQSTVWATTVWATGVWLDDEIPDPWLYSWFGLRNRRSTPALVKK